MKSDSGFFEFLSAKGVSKKLVVFLALGIILLLIGSAGLGGADTTEQVSDGELSSMCSSLVGVGECRVMVTYNEKGEVYAVAVLCEGAESVAVKERIYELVGSLYGIGTNRIAVLKIDAAAQK
ncbi:MAG: hypothetical protein J6Q85_07255 [Clostridia bacterium]|nr:hypothetical protein [Clostridia bacterium]